MLCIGTLRNVSQDMSHICFCHILCRDKTLRRYCLGKSKGNIILPRKRLLFIGYSIKLLIIYVIDHKDCQRIVLIESIIKTHNGRQCNFNARLSQSVQLHLFANVFLNTNFRYHIISVVSEHIGKMSYFQIKYTHYMTISYNIQVYMVYNNGFIAPFPNNIVFAHPFLKKLIEKR